MSFKAIQKMLARWEDALLSEPRSPRAARPPRDVPRREAVAVERLFELSCVCAVTDKPYVLQYRWAGKRLVFVKAIKLESSGRGHARPSGLAVDQQMAAVSAFKSFCFPCPWCGSDSINYCGANCGALVCGGRIRDGVFHCRPSCGASWTGVPLESIEGHNKTSVARTAAKFAGPPEARPATDVTQLAVRPPRHGAIRKF